MSRIDEERLQDVSDSCRRLAEIASKGRAEYDADWLAQDAANYNLSIIGESLGQLSDEFVA